MLIGAPFVFRAVEPDIIVHLAAQIVDGAVGTSSLNLDTPVIDIETRLFKVLDAALLHVSHLVETGVGLGVRGFLLHTLLRYSHLLRLY